jgi:hypothetical protein
MAPVVGAVLRGSFREVTQGSQSERVGNAAGKGGDSGSGGVAGRTGQVAGGVGAGEGWSGKGFRSGR